MSSANSLTSASSSSPPPSTFSPAHVVHISTERLLLRDIQHSDADRMFEMDSDERVLASLFGIPAPKSLEVTKSYIDMIHDQYSRNGFGRWAVVEKSNPDLFIGWAGLKIEKNVNGHESFIDLGYRFIPEYWNKGYASEASIALVAYGFKVLKVDKICAYIEEGNHSSRKVAERAGLHLESIFPSEHGTNKMEWWLELSAEEYYHNQKVIANSSHVELTHVEK